ncbi:hypothetical protein DTO164E3_5655 [Paecilomyces variotii]|nr:hypothetical protein DTO032I3_7438 [Paecilomyces variotii]KAJ9197513.1 hypothetical protein DTO164E3_5655 [Paecilomyces variotii]KAJ9220813.1 hypothetical protein DTO169C6_6898 [Paecilomyces variotii]KAJ9262362.1 hypothetical protein DTO212C5_7973 [Paecilomyces variotii]KAJ9265428.1 hypothetical protein DTO195F2_1774 [Paecilomyces variotii]
MPQAVWHSYRQFCVPGDGKRRGDRTIVVPNPIENMLSRRLVGGRLTQVTARQVLPRSTFSQIRSASTAENDDPGQNGNYPNPPRLKRAFRDPYGDWFDKQERRNFGEPLHEDNDILNVFSPEQYTHVTSGKAILSIGTFVAAFLGFCGLVSFYYPDKPSVPRTFPDGLEKELGGPGAVRARKHGEETW